MSGATLILWKDHRFRNIEMLIDLETKNRMGIRFWERDLEVNEIKWKVANDGPLRLLNPESFTGLFNVTFREKTTRLEQKCSG